MAVVLKTVKREIGELQLLELFSYQTNPYGALFLNCPNFRSHVCRLSLHFLSLYSFMKVDHPPIYGHLLTALPELQGVKLSSPGPNGYL